MSVSQAKPNAPRKQSSAPDIPQIMKQGRYIPWIYVAPALIVMLIFIVYPMVNTLYLSFRDTSGTDWATTACQPGQSCWGRSKIITTP